MDGQQNINQFYLRFKDMICLVQNYYLLRKTSIHFTYILNLDIFLYFLTNSPSKGDQNSLNVAISIEPS